MAKLRKMLGDVNSDYVISLMRLIETQSKQTIIMWCVNYAEENILGIYEKSFPEDARPRNALNSAKDWLGGKTKLPTAKKLILDAHAAAREAEAFPAAQAAARAVGQAASSIHSPSHSLGLAFYGSAAIAYDRVGLCEKPEAYEAIAAAECGKMKAMLRSVSVPDEKNPAKVIWNC